MVCDNSQIISQHLLLIVLLFSTFIFLDYFISRSLLQHCFIISYLTSSLQLQFLSDSLSCTLCRETSFNLFSSHVLPRSNNCFRFRSYWSCSHTLKQVQNPRFLLKIHFQEFYGVVNITNCSLTQVPVFPSQL